VGLAGSGGLCVFAGEVEVALQLRGWLRWEGVVEDCRARTDEGVTVE